MLPSRKLSRRKFFATFLPAIATVNPELNDNFSNRKYQLGNRVLSYRVCDDDRSLNFGGIDWETGVIVGYCLQFDEWRIKSFAEGWTYFILYDQTNNSDFTSKPWLDFEHETRIIKI